MVSASAAATGAAGAGLLGTSLKGAAASTAGEASLITGANPALCVWASFTLIVLTGIGLMVSSAAASAALPDVDAALAGAALAGTGAGALSAASAAAANFEAGQCCCGTDATS